MKHGGGKGHKTTSLKDLDSKRNRTGENIVHDGDLDASIEDNSREPTKKIKDLWQEDPADVPALDSDEEPQEEKPREKTEDELERERDFDLIDDNDDKEDFVIDPTKYQATFEIYKRVQKSK